MSTTYPHEDGDFLILGPEIFTTKDRCVISWQGENYLRQGVLVHRAHNEALTSCGLRVRDGMLVAGNPAVVTCRSCIEPEQQDADGKRHAVVRRKREEGFVTVMRTKPDGSLDRFTFHLTRRAARRSADIYISTGIVKGRVSGG